MVLASSLKHQAHSLYNCCCATAFPAFPALAVQTGVSVTYVQIEHTKQVFPTY